LITISAVVAAAIAAYFLFSTTSSATKTPMLEVTSAYALCSSSGTTTSCSAVYVTVRNVGAADVMITNAALEVAGGSPTFSSLTPNVPIPPGSSANLKFTPQSSNTNIPDGTSAVLTLTVQPAGSTSTQTISIAFKIARP
jgi:copper(I)-binding protein